MIGVLISSLYEFEELCREYNLKRRINNVHELYDGTKVFPITKEEDVLGRVFDGFIDKVRWYDLTDSQYRTLSKAKEAANMRYRSYWHNVGRRCGKNLANELALRKYVWKNNCGSAVVASFEDNKIKIKTIMHVEVTYNGSKFSVFGNYTKAEDPERDYPGAPAEFEIKEISYNDTDVKELLENMGVDLAEIENQILIDMG